MIMTTRRLRTIAAISVVAVAGLAVGACSSSDTSSPATDTPASTAPPPSSDSSVQPAETSSKTVVDIAASNPDFSTLAKAVDAAGLTGTLAGAGPFTVFAPTNEAFAKLPAGTPASLLKPENKEQLSAILTYHVVPAKVMAADVTPGTVKTVNGAELTINVDGSNVLITDGQGNTAKVVKTDIEASNGVVHVIDAVLLPPKS
jgi:uncharacterized surface protein with fasciclin (FAS1) repeats